MKSTSTRLKFGSKKRDERGSRFFFCVCKEFWFDVEQCVVCAVQFKILRVKVLFLKFCQVHC